MGNLNRHIDAEQNNSFEPQPRQEVEKNTCEPTKGFRKKLKSFISRCDLSRDPDLKHMIEEMSPWVATKRLLIVVDNVITAGLFSIYVSWTNNFVGGNPDPDLMGSLCKSVNDVTSHLLGEIPYFLFYLFMFWRAPRFTKVLPLNRYLNKTVFWAGVTIVFLVFDMISGGFLKTHMKDLWCGDIREPLSEYYPTFKRYLLLGSVFLILFLYRRVYLLYKAYR